MLSYTDGNHCTCACRGAAICLLAHGNRAIYMNIDSSHVKLLCAFILQRISTQPLLLVKHKLANLSSFRRKGEINQINNSNSGCLFGRSYSFVLYHDLSNHNIGLLHRGGAEINKGILILAFTHTPSALERRCIINPHQ